MDVRTAVVPHQGVRHPYINHSHPHINRPAQHMSCSARQVLHLWRAHSPPNPSLMRKLIEKLRLRNALAPEGLGSTMIS